MRLHQLQETADHLESAVRDQATALAEQTRDGLARGQKTVSVWKKGMERAIQKNPMLYAGAALAIIALLLTKLLFDRRR